MDATQNNSKSETSTVFIPPAGPQPNVNTQKKTEDVTNTKGYTFNDFNLSKEL